MKLIYFRSSDRMREPFHDKRNEGIKAVPVQLKQLKAKGHEVEIVDISKLSEKSRFDSYVFAIRPAVFNQYEIRGIFGTNRRSACWFGAEVPALIATGVDSVGDTYPHRKGNGINTIHDFLTKLLATPAD